MIQFQQTIISVNIDRFISLTNNKKHRSLLSVTWTFNSPKKLVATYKVLNNINKMNMALQI